MAYPSLPKENRLSFLLFLFLIAFAYLSIGIGREASIFDEGVVLSGADAVLTGKIPYADFFSLYPPGEFYFLAMIFKFFGRSIIITRLADTLIGSALSLIVFIFARRLSSSKLALISWAAGLVWMGYERKFSYPVVPAMLFGLVSALAVSGFFSGKRIYPLLILGGMATGTAALYRHDIGLYSLLSNLAALIIIPHICNETADSAVRVKDRKAEWLLIYCLGIAITAAPSFIYLISKAPLKEIVYQLIIFPSTVYTRFNSLPYPPPFGTLAGAMPGEFYLVSLLKLNSFRFAFYFPWIVYPLSAIFMVMSIRAKRHVPPEAAVLIILGLLSFNLVRVRSDVIHLAPFCVPAFILSGWLFGQAQYMKSAMSRAFTAILYFLIILTLFYPAGQMVQMMISGGGREAYLTRDHGIDRARNVSLFKDMADCVKYINDKVPGGEMIFVCNVRHDRIFATDVIFYFLSGRQCPTKYYTLLPGLATTLPVQERIAEDLKKNDVRYIVTFMGFDHVYEPNESAKTSGVTLLDDFIKDNYRIERVFDRYTVWVRV